MYVDQGNEGGRPNGGQLVWVCGQLVSVGGQLFIWYSECVIAVVQSCGDIGGLVLLPRLQINSSGCLSGAETSACYPQLFLILEAARKLTPHDEGCRKRSLRP